MSEQEWYFADHGEQKGPYRRQQIDLFIADGIVRPDTLVWSAGMANWQEMRSTELGRNAPPPPPPSPGQRPLAGSAAPASSYDGSTGRDHGSGGYTYSGTGGGAAPAMDFKTAVSTCLREKYVTFTGRASRSEYWYFVLFNIVASIASNIVDAIIVGVNSGFAPVSTIVGLGLLLPGLAAGVRRLHDTDRSGWWMLIVFVPLIGLIAMIYFLVQKGTEGSNRFG